MWRIYRLLFSLHSGAKWFDDVVMRNEACLVPQHSTSNLNIVVKKYQLCPHVVEFAGNFANYPEIHSSSLDSSWVFRTKIGRFQNINLTTGPWEPWIQPFFPHLAESGLQTMLQHKRNSCEPHSRTRPTSRKKLNENLQMRASNLRVWSGSGMGIILMNIRWFFKYSSTE